MCHEAAVLMADRTFRRALTLLDRTSGGSCLREGSHAMFQTRDRILLVATNSTDGRGYIEVPETSLALTAGIPRRQRWNPAQPRRWQAWRPRRWNVWWPGRDGSGAARRSDRLRSGQR